MLLATNIYFLLVDFYIAYLESFCFPSLTSMTPELASKLTSYLLLYLWMTARSWSRQRVGFLCCKTAAFVVAGGSVSPIGICYSVSITNTVGTTGTNTVLLLARCWTLLMKPSPWEEQVGKLKVTEPVLFLRKKKKGLNFLQPLV